MKIVGLILVGLCAGFVSGRVWPSRSSDPFNRFVFWDLRSNLPTDELKKHSKSFDPFNHFGIRDLRMHLSKEDLDGYCEEIYNDYSLETVIGFSPFYKYNILKFCGHLYYGESSKIVSTEIPPATKSGSAPVSVSTNVSSEIRHTKLSNSLRSGEKTTNYTNSGAPDDFSRETSTFLKTNTNTDLKISEDFSSTDASNVLGLIAKIANPKTSSESSIEESKEADGIIEITSPEVSDDASLTQESNATKKSREITNTTFSDNFSKEMYETTDEINKTTNSTAPDVDTSDETSGVEYSTIPDKKQQTESSSKLTDRTSDVKDSSSPSTPVTTISKDTSDETTDVSDSLETSIVTAGTSESTNSEISESKISSETSTETQTTSVKYHSTTPMSTAFISTDYSTSEKTYSDIESESSSTLVSSSSVIPNIPSTTRLYSTERVTKVTSSPQSQETTLGNTETTHSITTIELPETRTLKLAVSITFLVIALISLVVLIVYLIATRRPTFSYDELTLLP